MLEGGKESILVRYKELKLLHLGSQREFLKVKIKQKESSILEGKKREELIVLVRKRGEEEKGAVFAFLLSQQGLRKHG